MLLLFNSHKGHRVCSTLKQYLRKSKNYFYRSQMFPSKISSVAKLGLLLKGTLELSGRKAILVWTSSLSPFLPKKSGESQGEPRLHVSSGSFFMHGSKINTCQDGTSEYFLRATSRHICSSESVTSSITHLAEVRNSKTIIWIKPRDLFASKNTN